MSAEQLLSIVSDNPGWYVILLVVILSMIQFTPVKINPWSAIFKAIGKAITGDLCEKVDTVAKQQVENRQLLDKHIADDEASKMDELRKNILHFNNELLRNLWHTKEEFVEILSDIDKYRRYCKTHEDYPNSRAEHAIANIERVYDERLVKKDFLETSSNSGKREEFL